MRKAHTLKLLKHLGLVGLALNLTAFTAPQKGDLVELTGFVNGRSAGLFRDQDRNVLYTLPAGTRAQIAEKKYFEDTKNYGLCLVVKNVTDLPSDSKCVWVYYDMKAKNPPIRLYTLSAEGRTAVLDAWTKDPRNVSVKGLKKETNPAKAEAAQTTRAVTGVVEKKAPAKPAATAQPAVAAPIKATVPTASLTKGADSKSMEDETLAAFDAAKAATKGLAELNDKQGKVMTPATQCPDGKCNTKIETVDKSCSTKNGYLEGPLSALLSQSSYSEFFKSSQKEIIRADCVERNLRNNGSGRKMQCSADGTPRSAPEKACISENYVDVTAKSFNLAAECFGSMGGTTQPEKEQFALSVFSLMAQESGMHMNVMSPRGAGGSGQLTDDAIIDVNQHIKGIRSELEKSSNPNCSQVLSKTFDKPMKKGGICDRIGIAQDNPLKNMAYSFAYQRIVHDSLSKAFFDNLTFSDIFKGLPKEEASRLEYSLVSWGHNTGPAGLKTPLAALLRDYVRKDKTLRTKEDVDQFLSDLAVFNWSHPHPANRHRTKETSQYYSNIQTKMKKVTTEPRSCLAN